MRLTSTARALLPLLIALGLGGLARAGDPPPPAPPKAPAAPKPPRPPKPPQAQPPLAPPAPAVPVKQPVAREQPAWPKGPLGDPRRGEVPLPAQGGWNAFLMLDNEGVGVWTAKSFPVFEQLACPEVVGLDDYGRMYVMVSYSGKWTPVEAVHDGWWLGGLAHADVDPRIPGRELYTGSRKGRLWQVVAHAHGALESRLIAHLPGREIHTLVAGDLAPHVEGTEVLLFTRPGGLFLVTPNGEHGRFVTTYLGDSGGRVRDALVFEAAEGEVPEIATVSRDGRLRLLRLQGPGPAWQTIASSPMGRGRLAMAPGSGGRVLYSTLDDGRIERHARLDAKTWRTETIYLGPQGPRGLAAGVLTDGEGHETVATFGYGKQVQLLSREGGSKSWTVETIYEDPAAGHWLCTCEVDGRNATRELVACGFGGRMVLLARPPGYGRPELADPPAVGEPEGVRNEPRASPGK